MEKQPLKQRFEIHSVTDMTSAGIGAVLPTSDFSILTRDNKFIQFKFIEEGDIRQKTIVKPGIWGISYENNQFKLCETKFTDEPILKEYDLTAKVRSKIDHFFEKLETYKKYKLFPKRSILTWGSAGVGKTATLSKICTDYVKDGKTACVTWPTAAYNAEDVKKFVKSFEYDVEKFIFIIEDIGGKEYSPKEYGKMPVDSALLSLLDNMEQTFKVPTLILSTTNYPENLIEPLTNRPQRFDEIIEFPYPSGNQRKDLLIFFLKTDQKHSESLTNNAEYDKAMKYIQDKRFDQFSIAHLKEVIIRAELEDMTLTEAMDSLLGQQRKSLNDFQKDRKPSGF